MAEGSDQERTERATPKRREKARQQGQVAKSHEIPASLVLLAALGFLYWNGQSLVGGLAAQLQLFLERLATPRLEDSASAMALIVESVLLCLRLLLPLLLTLLGAALLANLAQVGFFFSSESLAPKFAKLNPLAGIRRMVSLRGAVELVKSLTKIVFVGGIAYLVVRREIEGMAGLMLLPVPAILNFIVQTAFRVILNVGIALAVLAAADYLYQRWQYERSLRMTKQEIKDEQRQAEGDPKIKARIRALQREMARKRMMQAVPQADVVITNPTHLAIALKFDAASMLAPQVVAKGAGHVAARIRELARESGVPLVEQKPLAQALYKSVPLEATIPADLYRAVAEILAYVYRLKGVRPAAYA